MGTQSTRRATAVLGAAVLLLVGAGARQAGAQGFDHSAWDRTLKRFVSESGRVDYATLKADSGDLDRYVAQIAARSPLSHPKDFPTRASQSAYWINAYNALVIEGIVEHWPVKSVREIGLLPFSFFWRKRFVVGGRKMTLDDIEHTELRKKLAEPRIHFALVCGATSCPRLRREAYRAENVERYLTEAATFFVNEPRNLKIEPTRNRVTLARIFSWYRDDFENHVRANRINHLGQPLLDYVRLFANEANRKALAVLHQPTIEFFRYDWVINDVHAEASASRERAQTAPTHTGH